jgi:hypothetical protein
MRGPYTVIPLRDDNHVYVRLGPTETHAQLPEARKSVREWFERTGIVPDVTDVTGSKVMLFTNEEVGVWAIKREPKPLDTGDDLV